MTAAWRFKVAYLLLFGGIGVLFNYYALYLQRAGLSGTQIGAVLGTLALARVLSQPLWGLVGDIYRVRRLILSGSCLGSALAALALGLTTDFGGLLAITALLAIANGPINPFCDALSLEYLERESRREEFGSLRLWGSAGFAVTSLLTGWLVIEREIWLLIYLYSGCMFAMAVITFRVPDAPRAERATWGGGRALWGSGTFLGLLAGAVLLGTTLGVANNFLIVYLDAIGAAGWVSGVTFALAGLLEVPLMGSARRIIERFGLRRVLVGGVALQPLRWLLYLVISVPALVIPTQLFHSLAMLSLLIAGVLYADQLLPSQWRATGQTVFSAALHGIGPTIGVFGAGLIYEYAGLAMVWWACVVANIAGALIWWVVTRGGRRPVTAPVA